jgi:chemotaxis family two-component system response regulator Rcp1
MASVEPTRVLVIEDSRMDFDLLCMAFGDVRDWSVDITLAEDGEKALDLLRKQAADPGNRSDFVVLDLNVPRHDGAEILYFIRNTPAIASVPVAIFSSSPEDVIKRQLTSAGVLADGHFTKPLDFDKFLGLGRVLRDWYECRKQVDLKLVHHSRSYDAEPL